MKYLLLLLLLGLAGCDPAPTEARALEWDRPRDSALPVSASSALTLVSARPTGCGTRSKPCPMQAMMRGAALAAVAQDDFAAMEATLTRIAELEPRGYSGWSDIALRGVQAARDHDKAGVRSACSGCHSLHRESFRASELRSVPLSSL